MNLIGQLGLLNYVPDKFEIVEEDQKLPDQPKDDQHQGTDSKAHHDLSVFQFLVGSWTDLIDKAEHGDFHADIAEFDEDVGPVGYSGL